MQQNDWGKLATIVVPLRGEPLDLAATLDCGQAFRWWPADREVWEGVAGGRAWRFRVAGDDLLAQAAPELSAAEVAEFLAHYFSLDTSLRSIHADLAARHPAVAEAIRERPGLRILRQEPVETLLSFAVASATSVRRIQRCIARICARFGEVVAVVDGSEYWAYPPPDVLAAAPETELADQCNLEYRASHLQAVARALLERGTHWLRGLARLPYPEAHAAVDSLPFVGPKIADCVCLFGLGFDEAVPVDVHIWAIAHELFGASIQTKTLTPKTYSHVADLYRALFGQYAGWAQQYLYAARRARRGGPLG